MEIYKLSFDGGVEKISALPLNARLVCAFGCFDGVHIGHRALLSSAVADAERLNSVGGAVAGGCEYVPVVWTFSEPVSVPWVISVSERLSYCGRCGIKYALCQRFEDVRTLSPEKFVEGLVSEYGVRHAVCGFNFRFGYKGEGDPARLERCLGRSLERLRAASEGMERCVDSVDGERLVTVVGKVCALGDVVSSTRIRALLMNGEMESASVLLGRGYSLSGTIVAGKQIGRTISRPTANLVYSPDQLIPKRGVYFTYCRVKGKMYRAVTNVGYRPTVNSDPASVTCEAHLLDFSESVYGERAEIIFVHYHRAEMAFSSVDELSEKISDDVRRAVEYFDNECLLER